MINSKAITGFLCQSQNKNIERCCFCSIKDLALHHGQIVLSKNWESECSNHGKLITLFRLNPHLRILGAN